MAEAVSYQNPTENNLTRALSTRNGFVRYFTINFGEVDRREINPYDVDNEITKFTGEKPRAITGERKNTLTIQCRSKAQAEKIVKITKISNTECKIFPHAKFNQSKGLIFLKEFDIEDVEELENELGTTYNVARVERANFIKTRSGIQAFIVTFNEEAPPYDIYIPGERSDTTVKPYYPRPMLCKKCWDYGHTLKNCKEETPICKQCSSSDHESNNCTAETLFCHHCGEAHEVGSKECERWIKEQEILKIADREKVSFVRARQKMNEDSDTQIRPIPKFPTTFDCKVPQEEKRKIKPWLLEKCVAAHIDGKPISIRTKDPSTFIIEVSNKRQSKLMTSFNNINGIPAIITINTTANVQKGLIYTQGYYMNDFEAYKKGLQEQYGITDVEEAIWIKPKRNSASKPLILSFRSELPAYLDIPGETIRTKVYEYKKFPTHCSNCLEYGHPKRICRDDKRCANCTSTSHSDNTCGNEPKCLQCNGNHRSGYKKCREYLFECEVLALQSKSRISKSQARLIFERENPNFRTMNYSQAVTSNTQNSETPLQQPTAPTNQPPKPPNETTQQHAITDSPILQKLSTNTPKSNSSKKSQENEFPKPPTNIQNEQIEKTLTNITDTDVLHEDELTSRNNPEKYYETKKIYDEYDPSNQDRDKYEEEPKKSAVKRKNSPISPNRKETPKNANPKDQKKSRGDYSEDRPGSGDRRKDEQRRSGSHSSRSNKKRYK